VAQRTGHALALMLGAMLLVCSPAGAQQSPVVTTLVSQPVEPPAGPICWRVSQCNMAVGDLTGAEARHAEWLEVSYLLTGTEMVTTPGGFALGIGPGGATLVPPGVSHVHRGGGPDPVSAITFALSCAADPHDESAASTLLQTDTIPGVPVDAGPLQVTLRTAESVPGSQGPVVQHPGPVVYYVRSGQTAISTAGGARFYEEGEAFVVPPFTPYQYSNVGPTPNRSVYVFLTPADATLTTVLVDVSLPQP
jgi:mannose-6-phosphate isomerase-like protein (cupin superfamily)